MVAFSKVFIATAVGFATAHPGESHSANHVKREIVARENAAHAAARSLASCGNSAGAQALKARSVQRRAEALKSLRQKRGIKAPARKNRRTLEDLQAWEAVNHNQTGVYDYDAFTPLANIFDANTSCILAPEITDGPYYVAGEYFRSNVIESESCEGVNLFLEVQYIDVNTCEAIPSVAVDVWNCNATGVYSGVDSTGQAGLNSTFLRGIQLTDNEGVVQFETIFPGHYSGRAIHTHLLAHTNATLEPNGTISVFNAPVTHIGQLFYPDDLRAEVEATYPYNTNTADLTTNDEDMWSIVQADSSYDPIPSKSSITARFGSSLLIRLLRYVYLGDDISDGLFAWIQIGVNASADYSTDDYYGVAAYLAADGGHSTGYTVGGGGGDGGEGNGTAPSGALSGAPPSSTA